MRKLARIVLVAVLVAGGFFALPKPAARLFTSEAQAQIVPTPSIPPILGDPKPDEEDPVDPGDDEEEPSDPISKPGSGDGGSTGGSTGGKLDKPSGKDKDKAQDDGRDGRPGGNTFVGGDSHIAGSFSTGRLVSAAAKLRALGVPSDEVIEQIYPPFIIAGDAAWTDTWGAPRYGPGPLVRTHQGQDVFCRYGDPILAPADGTVSYSDGGLGGVTARVHTSDNAYYYLTHLSGTNAGEFPGGSSVQTGDVVGYCGNSGNAITTPPHVHFGYYVNGVAQNPMRALVKWLETAEERVLGIVAKQQKRNVLTHDRRLAERLFGDAFAPDLSELESGDGMAADIAPAPEDISFEPVDLQSAINSILNAY